jgi:condensin complex subunit 3
VLFTAKFAATDENGNVDSEFAVGLLEHLLAHSAAKDKAVRLRTCQLVGAILGSMGDKLDISDELWDEALEKMLLRCRDKVPSVRAAAALALSFFQDPDEADDEPVAELSRMMRTDAGKDVRKTALQHIAITSATLPLVLGRLRDNKPDVRKLLFQVIAWKLPIKKLNMAQRCEILCSGLRERVTNVREACVDLLCNTWLRDNSASDPFKLLSWLDVDCNEEIAADALKAVFGRYAKARKHIVNGPACWDSNARAKLEAAAAGEDQCFVTPELALYLRVRCQWWKSQRQARGDVLDDLILDISSMAELASYHYRQSKDVAPEELDHGITDSDVYITRQLLQCIEMADFSDEAGRTQVSDLNRTMLGDINTPEAVVEPALSCFRVAMPDEDAYIRSVVEQIVEMKEPLMADSSTQHNEDDSSLEQIWLRCLGMASFLLKSTSKRLENGELDGMEETMLLPAIQHREAVVRDRGVLALGQYCLLDKDVAKRYMILFLQAIRNDVAAIQLTAMQVLFDFLFAFDLSAEEAAGTPSMQSVALDTLVPYLSNSDTDMRTMATEGVAKLMLSNRVNDPKLLSRLLILFYNPTTAEDTRLRQCLSIFFQAYAFSSPHHRLCLEACFLPTLRVCVHAPKTSPLRQIHISDLAEYVLNLTNNAAQPDSSTTAAASAAVGGTAAEMAAGIHERLGVVLLNEIISDGDAAETRAFCKALMLLNVDSTTADGKVNTDALNTLKVLAVNAVAVVENRFAKTSLSKFQTKLAQLQMDGPGFNEAQQEAVLARTKSHVARRQGEITQALFNQGEGGDKKARRSRRRGASVDSEEDEQEEE